MSSHLTPLGPLMVDVSGFALTDSERQRLCHPAVGGVILFARNFESRAQLMALTAEIRALRHPHLLIAGAQDGGRGFSSLSLCQRYAPPSRRGAIWC